MIFNNNNLNTKVKQMDLAWLIRVKYSVDHWILITFNCIKGEKAGVWRQKEWHKTNFASTKHYYLFVFLHKIGVPLNSFIYATKFAVGTIFTFAAEKSNLTDQIWMPISILKFILAVIKFVKQKWWIHWLNDEFHKACLKHVSN